MPKHTKDRCYLITGKHIAVYNECFCHGEQFTIAQDKPCITCFTTIMKVWTTFLVLEGRNQQQLQKARTWPYMLMIVSPMCETQRPSMSIVRPYTFQESLTQALLCLCSFDVHGQSVHDWRKLDFSAAPLCWHSSHGKPHHLEDGMGGGQQSLVPMLMVMHPFLRWEPFQSLLRWWRLLIGGGKDSASLPNVKRKIVVEDP